MRYVPPKSVPSSTPADTVPAILVVARTWFNDALRGIESLPVQSSPIRLLIVVAGAFLSSMGCHSSSGMVAGTGGTTGAVGGAAAGGTGAGGQGQGGSGAGGSPRDGSNDVGQDDVPAQDHADSAVGGGDSAETNASVAGNWVGTWACGPQLTETANLPPAPGLSGNTLRQIVYVSIPGTRLRVQLSNAFGDGPVTMNAVHLAVSTGAGAIDTSTDVGLTFAGSASITIPAGQAVFSDAFDYPLTALANIAITIAFGAAPAGVTGHPGSRTTSYLVAGNAVAAQTLTAPATAEHWYYITGIDVMADAATSAIVALGDSLTDGRGSTTNLNDRWPDDLSRRLRALTPASAVAVLNQGIGGNAVVSGGLGPTAVARFARDVLNQRGVRYLIVLEGVNDIGTAAAGTGPAVANNLITAFGSFIDMAHARNIRAYGIPITPFGGNTGYDTPEHQTARTTVNTWIRTSGRFDGVIDLDAAVGDPQAPANLLPGYDSGDHLHLNPAGYQKMADSIDLTLFTL